YDSGDDFGAAEAANMAKYAAAEASIKALDQAIQTHGGAGLTKEYGLAAMLGAARIARVAPVRREMILNFVSQHSLGLPRSYEEGRSMTDEDKPYVRYEVSGGAATITLDSPHNRNAIST